MLGRRASRLAPPRRIARGGSPPRCAALLLAPLAAPLAVPHARVPLRAPHSCPVAVGRDVPIAPPRHRRGARLCHRAPRRPRCASSHHTRSLPVRCAAWRAQWCGPVALEPPAAPHRPRWLTAAVRGFAPPAPPPPVGAPAPPSPQRQSCMFERILLQLFLFCLRLSFSIDSICFFR